MCNTSNETENLINSDMPFLHRMLDNILVLFSFFVFKALVIKNLFCPNSSDGWSQYLKQCGNE